MPFTQSHRSIPEEVVDGRNTVYGDPTETFSRIAQVWSGILGHTVNATDVPLCLIGLKLIRTVEAPDYSDNSDDIEGYLDIFRKIVGDRMISARSVSEYMEKKAERAMPFPEVFEQEALFEFSHPEDDR